MHTIRGLAVKNPDSKWKTTKKEDWAMPSFNEWFASL
jgi:hypothetical protein